MLTSVLLRLEKEMSFRIAELPDQILLHTLHPLLQASSFVSNSSAPTSYESHSSSFSNDRFSFPLDVLDIVADYVAGSAVFALLKHLVAGLFVASYE